MESAINKLKDFLTKCTWTCPNNCVLSSNIQNFQTTDTVIDLYRMVNKYGG